MSPNAPPHIYRPTCTVRPLTDRSHVPPPVGDELEGIIDIFPERPKEAPEHKVDGCDNLVAEEASLGQEPRGHRSNGVLGETLLRE